MLRLARLPPGRRALLSHPLRSAARHPTTTTVRPITFATGKGGGGGIKPFTFLGESDSARPSIPRMRPPSTWSPSTIATLALGSMLVGTWYIWEEGRSYKVAADVDKYEPRVLGTHRREERVNRDYVNYDHWVEEHKHRREHKGERK